MYLIWSKVLRRKFATGTSFIHAEAISWPDSRCIPRSKAPPSRIKFQHIKGYFEPKAGKLQNCFCTGELAVQATAVAVMETASPFTESLTITEMLLQANPVRHPYSFVLATNNLWLFLRCIQCPMSSKRRTNTNDERHSVQQHFR